MDRNQLLNDAESAFRIAFEGRQSQIWTTFPAIVQSINWDEMTVEVIPAIQGSVEGEDGSIQYVNMPLLVDVPINFPSVKNFVLTLPIAAGDEVLVHIASRCIDSWWQSGGVQKPAEFRMHDLSDGFAVPGIYSKPNVIPNISTTDMQLRNRSGTTYIGIKPSGEIDLVSPVGIKVTGDLTVSGEVTAGIIPIPLTTHLHPVTTAPGTTGAPIP